MLTYKPGDLAHVYPLPGRGRYPQGPYVLIVTKVIEPEEDFNGGYMGTKYGTSTVVGCSFAEAGPWDAGRYANSLHACAVAELTSKLEWHRSRMPQFDYKHFAARSRELRVSAGELAALCGVSSAKVSDWRHGKSEPSPSQIDIIAKRLGLSEWALMTKRT